MRKGSNVDSRIELLKELPRRPLEPAAEHAILLALRQEGGREAARRRLRIGRLALLAVPAVVLVVVAMFFGIFDRGGEGLFGSRPSAVNTAELSPLFDLLDKDGRVVYPDRLRGKEGKIAYSEYPGGFVANSGMTVSKVFWYVWGDPEQVDGAELVATGVNLSTGKRFLVNETKLSGPIYGADAHVVTQFNPFPSKGTWRIDVELDGEPYGSIVVRVKDEYIHTKSSIFLASKEDAATGVTETTLIVDGHGLPETLDVIVQPTDVSGEARKLTFVREQEFVQAMKPVTHYSGKLEFDAPGKWRIEVLGEKTEVKVRP
ncbi:hypothetical protein [Cohnella cellulosilytica]|uniref:DUF4179 domain-containing protein n=1 Tax=Cohnella cellulosilytica TaxID=986710 RepID=A0ABW2F4S0_9BACL